MTRRPRLPWRLPCPGPCRALLSSPSSATSFGGWDRLRRFVAQPDSVAGTRWTAPKTLLQKWPAPAFSATTVLDFSRAAPGESAGLVVFRQDYAWIGLKKGETGTRLVVAMAKDARNGTAEREVASHNGHGPRVCLRATVSAGGRWRFSASADNRQFTTVGEAFTAKPGL